MAQWSGRASIWSNVFEILFVKFIERTGPVMFFTDPDWRVNVSVAGMASSLPPKFYRWRLVGLPLHAPTFIISPQERGRDLSDTQALMAGDPDVLIQLLKQTWPHAPVVRALVHGKIVRVHEIWTYSVARWVGYAYKARDGGLQSCSPYQPDVPVGADACCIWTSRQGIVEMAGEDERMAPG